MKLNKKFGVRGQGALEFIIIFIFIFVIIGIVMALTGKYAQDIKEREHYKELDGVAEMIKTEVEIYQKSGGGYTRKFEIPAHLQKRFNVTFNQSYLVFQDKDFDGDDGPLYYYELTGDYTPEIVEEGGVTYVVFNKTESSIYSEEIPDNVVIYQ
ncbi:MAG: hypothetical protein ACOCXG_01560 [Nanoarchaeota archaeon]